MKQYFYAMVAIVLLMLCGISISDAAEPKKQYWYKYTVQCYFPNKVEAFKTDDFNNTSLGFFVLKEPKIIVEGRYLSTGKSVRVPINNCIVYEN